MKKIWWKPFRWDGYRCSVSVSSLSGITEGEPLYTLFQGTIFESPIHITFLGIPVILMSYASSVIPIILAAYVGSKLEKWFIKVIPDVVKSFLVPFFTLLVIVPITFIVIGPIATWISSLLGQATVWAYDLSPLLAGLILGGLWQLFVMFGLHWGFIPIAMNNLAVFGYDFILALISATSLATTGVVLGVMARTKQQKIKTLSIPAAISSIFGVSEPAIYGITLPLKRPFIITLITSAVGGGIMGATGTKVYMMGGLGVFGIPSKIGSEGLDIGFWGGIIAMGVNLVLGFILAYLFGLSKKNKDGESLKEEDNHNSTDNNQDENITSPLKGTVLSLSEVKDEAFSTGALGKGLAIDPTEGKLVSPVSGTVTALFPTNHAVGITTDNGAEILMHIGLDTVQLNGKFFKSSIKQGDRIEKGQLLIDFDVEQIKQAGFSVVTPVLITNSDKYKELILTNADNVDPGGQLIKAVIH